GALCISVTARADDTSNNFNMNQSENNNNLSLTTNIQQQTINTLEETRLYLIHDNLLSQQQASQLEAWQLLAIYCTFHTIDNNLRTIEPNFSLANNTYHQIVRGTLYMFIHDFLLNNNT
ncbi:MAG: hypothetical protein IJS10_00895, partial [Alphaproteobacteria bacterium]|nr:hypothetical protein [Alphaproteobacteria bacterium]